MLLRDNWPNFPKSLISHFLWRLHVCVTGDTVQRNISAETCRQTDVPDADAWCMFPLAGMVFADSEEFRDGLSRRVCERQLHFNITAAFKSWNTTCLHRVHKNIYIMMKSWDEKLSALLAVIPPSINTCRGNIGTKCWTRACLCRCARPPCTLYQNVFFSVAPIVSRAVCMTI